MPKRFVVAFLSLALCFCGTACKKTAAQNLAEIRQQFQAQQRKKAIDNYQQIIRKYPDSPFAPMAQERLRALNALPESQGKK
jgi:thiaminase